MLEKIAKTILNSKHIFEKSEIRSIVQFINANSYKSPRIFSDIGEDSAAVYDDDNYILLTTDRIKTSFIKKSPFGAGFSSILVSVDDIYCCGGVPLASSIILSYSNQDIGQKMMEGICEGSRKFQVPIIRGHTNIDSNYYELSSTIIGEIQKDHYISAKNARIGDILIMVSDFDGKVGKASDLYWDTVTFKTSEEILQKRKAMNIVAKTGLVNASKDISNGGIFGTIIQLARYSNLGADICVSDITIPRALKDLDYTLSKYIKMYLTTSFILTAPENNYEQIIKIFKDSGMHANSIGSITKEKVLKINNGKDSLNVIKF
ncbi:MAG: AIR synthase related protein [Promethearchaeota archaeon]